MSEPETLAALRCASGRHTWLDATSRAVCCNGYRKTMRRVGAPPLPGELEGGHTYYSDRELAGWCAVWVPE